MRRTELVPDRLGEMSKLDAEVCTLLVVQAELACLPTGSEHRQSLGDQRDRLRRRLDDRQLEQLRRIRDSLDALIAPEKRSEAA